MANSYSFANQPGVFYIFGKTDLFQQLFPLTNTPADFVDIGSNLSPTAIAMDNTPNSILLFVGTNSGNIYYATNPGANPPVWTQVPGINLNEPIVSIVFAPGTPGMAYAISSSGVVFQNLDVTNPNNWTNMGSNWAGGPVVEMAVTPVDSSTLYLITGNQIAESNDGGATGFPSRAPTRLRSGLPFFSRS